MKSTLSLLLVLLNHFFMPRHNAQLRLLKAQIAILRARIPTQRIILSPAEKAELLRIGAECGHEVDGLLEVGRPATYRRWLAQPRTARLHPAGLGAPLQHRAPASWARHLEQLAADRLPARPRRPDPQAPPAWRHHYILHPRRGVSAMFERSMPKEYCAGFILPGFTTPDRMNDYQCDRKFLHFGTPLQGRSKKLRAAPT